MTKIEFRNYKGDYCAFTDDSVIFSNSELKEAKVFPFGSIKKITAFFGVKLIAYNGDTFFFSFLHMRKRIKRKIKGLVEKANIQKSEYDKLSPYNIDIDENKKENIEQIRKPHMSRKKTIKFWSYFITVLVTALILITLIIGLANEYSGNSKQNSQYSEVQPNWQEQWQ